MTSSTQLTREAWASIPTSTSSAQSRKLHDLLRQTETAIAALNIDVSSIDIAASISKFITACPLAEQTNLAAITEMKDAENVFEESTEQAKQVYRFLWRQGTAVELSELRNVEELQEAGELVEEIVEVKGEKTVGEVASLASMLAAYID